MKNNTLRKTVVGTIIAVVTAVTALAPATVVMANDGYEALYDENGYKYWYNTDVDRYYYADADGNVACDGNGPIEMARPGKSASLDYSAYGATRYTNVSDFLALRTGPSPDCDMIASLAPNAEVTIIGTTGNWAKVYAPSADADGYVAMSYLSKSRSSSGSTSGQTSVTYRTVFGTTNYLALRNATAYDDNNEIARLHDGDKVRVLENDVNGTGYARVYVPGIDKTGYVNNEYLRNQG